MSRIIFVLLVLGVYGASNPSYADSLQDIANFSKEICEEIELSGNITKETISGKLDGEIKGVAKVLGISLGTDGTIDREKTSWDGIPYDKLEKQYASSRECKLDLAKVLIDERKQLVENQELQTQKLKISWKDGNLIGLGKNNGRAVYLELKVGWKTITTINIYDSTCPIHIWGVEFMLPDKPNGIGGDGLRAAYVPEDAVVATEFPYELNFKYESELVINAFHRSKDLADEVNDKEYINSLHNNHASNAGKSSIMIGFSTAAERCNAEYSIEYKDG